MQSPSELLVLGSPGDRRVDLLQAALRRRAAPAARFLSWLDVIDTPGRLAAELTSRTIVRIESPGMCFPVHRALIAAGAGVPDHRPAARISRPAALALAEERGRIWFPRQWFLGFAAVLAQIEAELGGARRMGHPLDIVCLFNKPACHVRLRRAGVPVAEALGPVESYDELRARMASQGVGKAFVKLAHGSSASGVMALSAAGCGPRAFTTVERVRSSHGDRLYNTKRIQLYARESEIAPIVNALAREGVQVERWLPKATLENRPLDLRIVTVAGTARHVVVRLGRTVITNLHTGARRGELAALSAKLGWDAVERARLAAAAAAAAFPRSLMTGVDVLLDPAGRVTVLEVNAFGDLLPGALDRGEDTYEAQLAAVLGPGAPALEMPCST